MTAAVRALASGDALAALGHVALRRDAAAVALRGIAMAQLGDLARARAALRVAARAFGPQDALGRARCLVADAEIALVVRDLHQPAEALAQARATLEAHGDRLNAAHARNIEARRLLLIGSLEEAERVLAPQPGPLPPVLAAGRELVIAGIAIRRLQIPAARAALQRAQQAARKGGVEAMTREVRDALAVLQQPAARLLARGEERLLSLQEMEGVLRPERLVIDACRSLVHDGDRVIPLATRPVLFALARALGEAWPADAPREALVARAFRGRQADESHRARLRVEIGRLRTLLASCAQVRSTRQGFVLTAAPGREVVVLAPPREDEHAAVLALLADGEAWSSSALALVLGTSPRTVQRSLEQLARAGKAQGVGQGRARRWMSPPVPGFPAMLLLPWPLSGG